MVGGDTVGTRQGFKIEKRQKVQWLSLSNSNVDFQLLPTSFTLVEDVDGLPERGKSSIIARPLLNSNKVVLL